MITPARRDANALFAGPVEHVTRRPRYVGTAPRQPVLLKLPDVAARLRELESMAARLTVYHSNPERFFEERSELKAGIGVLAKQLEGKS